MMHPFKLERYFAAYEFTAPYILCASNCEPLTVEEVLSLEPGAGERFLQHSLGYTESMGAKPLREGISALYQTVGAEEILVHAGAEEAIFTFMHAVLRPGDHVIVHWPCYQSLFEIPRSLGAMVDRWEAREEKQWALDFSDIKRLIKPNTKAIVINCPHNPTGYVMSPDEQTELIALCQKQGIILFSDEVYRELELAPTETLPAACDLDENAVSLGVMSKSFGLAELRIGWVATRNRTVYEAMAAFKDYTTICNSAPSEFLATVALRHHRPLVQRNRQIIAENLAVLDRFFKQHADIFAWQRPQSGPIAFPRLKTGGDIEAFCRDLVDTQGVMLLPGMVYDVTTPNFRIGFGRKNMPEAVALLEAYLKVPRKAGAASAAVHQTAETFTLREHR